MKLRRSRATYLLYALYGAVILGSIDSAVGTPQFARQTNLPCSSCHTHVPLLNEFGQRYYANGFKLAKSHKDQATVPFWGSLGAQGTVSKSLGGATPISWASTEIASFGSVRDWNTLYHFEYQPTEKQSYIYGIQPINSHEAVQIGELGLLAQYDPMLDVPISRPIYLLPAGAGSLGNGRSGPFAPGANAYGVRLTSSLTGTSALPYADGWKIAATVPFSNEAPCGTAPDFNSDATGLFLEGFRRMGMNSYGINYFAGRDGRRYYGTVEQQKLGKVFLEAGASFAEFNGAHTGAASLGATWTPSWDKAFSLRLDDQDGIFNYVPTVSWLVGGKTGALMLVAESEITHGVAPTTQITAQFKF